MASFVVLRCNTVCGYASLHAPSRALHINLTPRCVSAVMVPPPGLSRMQLAVWQATAWKGHRGVNWKTCTTICMQTEVNSGPPIQTHSNKVRFCWAPTI